MIDARIDWSVIEGAAQSAARGFEERKAAVRADRSKTHEQIMGILRQLSQEQADAVSLARKTALERERARTQKPRKPRKPRGKDTQSPADKPRV